MLRGIPALLPPDLVKFLMEMGHGDEIVLADRNYPGAGKAKRLVRCDGTSICELLRSMIGLFPLDEATEHHAILMAVPDQLDLVPAVWAKYEEILNASPDRRAPFLKLEKQAFYRRSEDAYAIVMTGEKERFANIILRKGIVKANEEEFV